MLYNRYITSKILIMLQVVQASELTLHEVKKKFNLRENQDDSFFPECG